MTDPLTLRAAARIISELTPDWPPTAIHATLKAMFSGRVPQFFTPDEYTRVGKQGRIMLDRAAVLRYVAHKTTPTAPVKYDPALAGLDRTERVECLKAYKAQEYSLRDIGVMFGKSHEWVRNELEKEGV